MIMAPPAREAASARAVLELDLGKLKKNCAALRRLAPEGAFFCPMAKAGGYGHGAAPVVQALTEEGVRQAGVATVSEAWQIRNGREAGPANRRGREPGPDSLDILVFGPVLNKEDLSWGMENHLVFVLGSWIELEALAKEARTRGRLGRAHLKFDTGFSRLGFELSEAEKLKAFLSKNPQIRLEGLASQLIEGSEAGIEKSPSRRQLERFLALKGIFPSLPFHALNTAGLISAWSHNMSCDTGSRPGIGLYGLKPAAAFASQRAKKKAAGLRLEPASRLKSFVAAVRRLKKGGRVSYSGEWTAPRPSVIIAVSIGYGDGFLRAAGQGGKGGGRQILFRGRRVPIAGRVCMDFFMADVTECLKGGQPLPRPGEEAVIFGRQGQAFLSVEEQSEWAGTIPYEMFVRLGDRVQRAYL